MYCKYSDEKSSSNNTNKETHMSTTKGNDLTTDVQSKILYIYNK